ncbi:hypothetical protein Tco_0720404 [Tanacetum coccineum]
MRSGVAVVLLPPCRLGLGRIRQAQFKDTRFQAQFKAFEALLLFVAFVLSFVYLSFSLSLTVLRAPQEKKEGMGLISNEAKYKNASRAEGDFYYQSASCSLVLIEAVIYDMDYHSFGLTEFNVIGTAQSSFLMRRDRGSLKFERAQATADRMTTNAAEASRTPCSWAVESLDRKFAELQSLVSTKDLELKDLNVALSSLKSQKDSLVDQVHALETTCSSLRDQVSGYERLKEQIEEFQDAQMNIVNDKVAKLDADLLEMALHLEEKFYPHLLTTISALGAAISPAIKMGMQDGLSAGINHKKAEFPLLTELKSHKEASTADVMNLLRLEGTLADAPGMSDLQPDVEQLTLPNHHPEDQVVLGEASTSGSMPADVVTTTALSTTFVAGNGQGNVASFPTVEFEKEELDTTPERDPPS